MANPTNRSEQQSERDQKDQKNAPGRPQAEVEEMLSKNREATDEALEAGKRVTDDAEEMTRRSAETIQQTVKSGVEMAAQVMERSLNQLARATIPGATGEVAQQSSRSLQAISASGVVLTNAFQKVSQDWLDRARDGLQRNLDATGDLLRCRNPSEAAAIQLDLVRRQMESFIEGSQHASELVSEAAAEALQKVKVEEARGEERRRAA